ncbi:MAG: hypothetical protein PHP34_04480 [Bacteroidales bacterium]|nr:hypothetical protein [Bacteroidales bacterium]
MKEKIDDLNKYMDDPQKMVTDDFSLFVTLEEILYIRSGTKDKTLDRKIYEVFHKVFSYYLEPIGGYILLINGDGVAIFFAETDANFRILETEKQTEFDDTIEKARKENSILKNEFQIKTTWDTIRPKPNDLIWTKNDKTWTKDEPYLMMGIINRNELNNNAKWNNFNQYINRDKAEIKRKKGDMILKRICDLYIECNFPFTDRVKYFLRQSHEPQPVTICELDADVTKKLYDVCVSMSVFKKCDIQTFANGFNSFDDCQPLEIKNKNLFCIVWYYWDQLFGRNNKEKAEAWLQSFGKDMPENVRKRGFYDIRKDFSKTATEPQRNLHEKLRDILL